MEIIFSSRKLAKICSPEKESIRTWGKDNARRVQVRLAQLQAAETLADVIVLPFGRCHALKGDRKGQFSVDVRHPFRLIFEPAHDPVPTKDDGGLDPAKVTRIRVLSVEDYHGD
jgi:proteic killer suppression protein